MDTRLNYSNVMKRGAPATTERRDALLAWLRLPTHDGYTARGIVNKSTLYDGFNGRQERCASDLRALERAGFVRTDQRIGGRWWPL